MDSEHGFIRQKTSKPWLIWEPDSDRMQLLLQPVFPRSQVKISEHLLPLCLNLLCTQMNSVWTHLLQLCSRNRLIVHASHWSRNETRTFIPCNVLCDWHVVPQKKTCSFPSSVLPSPLLAVSTLIETTHSEGQCIHVRVFAFKCRAGLMGENTDSRRCTTSLRLWFLCHTQICLFFSLFFPPSPPFHP